ncbi:tRNA (adenosine(37)-N6)-threonylcarbamoyltransferase complex transferase subunit TsaD [Patescibacteria group bacterium]|nr:tRNA (adenosine(37)-N6)-threonylcarbamoyltransferase complex transferase subunit TsaD [Patescibacteria group bacterium]
MNILAIESSCDETACAVIKDGTEILSSVVASSTAMHEKWGGIVPEVAAREQLASILPVLTEALQQFSDIKIQRDKDIKSVIKNSIDAVAITVGPGLIGSLLIGVEAAKTIAFATEKPIIPVNHVLAHMYANFLEEFQENSSRAKSRISRGTKSRDTIISFPAISLVVSGGHTELFLMKNEKDLNWLGGTIDDAAGEAFDKSARLLGFGSRGGVAIQEAANKVNCHCDPAKGGRSNLYNKDRHASLAMTKEQKINSLPRPMMHDDSLNFSFSGLKTAILREVNKLKQSNSFNNTIIEQLSYEVQEAITDVLVAKTMKAAEMYDAKSIMISGGVASNERLREKFIFSTISQPPHLPIQFHCPAVELCTDNAAFIGSYAYFRGKKEDWHTVTAIPDLSVEG